MKPLVLVGEAKGSNEDKIDKGFVGASGIELLRMLNESGIIELTETDYSYLSKFYKGDKQGPYLINAIWELHPEVVRTNVFQLHPPGNRIESLCGPKSEALPGYPAFLKGKYIRKEFGPELERLANELVDWDANLVVCLGNSALWALAGATGVSKLRGTTRISSHTATDFKLLATYHPAAVLRQWDLRPIAIADLMKAKRESEYPEIRRQKREIWIEPSIDDIKRFFRDHLGKRASVDIETSGTRITCIGFAPNSRIAIVIPFDDGRRKNGNYWPTQDDERAVWELIRVVLADRSILKTFQNGLYDIAFLWRAYGIKTYGAEHDTMLLHHALQPEMLKGLGFLGSIYADETAWKNERKGTTTIKRDE